MRVNAAIRIDAEPLDELHFAGRREIHERAFGIHGAHDRRVRQRLQRVMQIHARQRLAQLAQLHAHALAVHDEQRRTEFLHQPADLAGLERIDEAGATNGFGLPEDLLTGILTAHISVGLS